MLKTLILLTLTVVLIVAYVVLAEISVYVGPDAGERLCWGNLACFLGLLITVPWTLAGVMADARGVAID